MSVLGVVEGTCCKTTTNSIFSALQTNSTGSFHKVFINSDSVVLASTGMLESGDDKLQNLLVCRILATSTVSLDEEN